MELEQWDRYIDEWVSALSGLWEIVRVYVENALIGVYISGNFTVI